MIPFLQNIAKTYYKNYGQKISNFTFVFPNRRAGVFFRYYLSLAAETPIFSPQIFTVADLFEYLSPYQKIDRIELLFLLYDIYKSLTLQPESFDEFVYWGEMLLNDFDDIDKFLVNAQQLFTNIYDLKQIEADFSFMSEEQISAIKRFWSNFFPIGNNNKKKDFIEAWEILYPLYEKLRAKLAQQHLAYDGMIFRYVAENIDHDDFWNKRTNFNKIIFIGLNGHSKAEGKLLSYFKKRGIADFYWDYSSPLVCDSYNKSSTFVTKNKLLYPSLLQLEAETMSLNKPTVEAIGIPSAVGQAKYVHNILKELIHQKQIKTDEPLNTALVLSDENMLIPVLYSIPEEIDKINVTMGYNLANTSIAGFVQNLMDLQQHIQKKKDIQSFYHKPVLALLNHSYLKTIAPLETDSLKNYIVQYNQIMVPISNLHKHKFLELIFDPILSWDKMSAYLRNILTYLLTKLSNDTTEENEDNNANTNHIEIEFIVEYCKCVNRIDDALKNAITPQMSVDTYCKLLKKLITGVNVPFNGEPLSGLQIMGVLETRALDFDNIILLSMNEGIFPTKNPIGSFIPYNLRKGFELPTYEYKDSIFAYHFYRLINRAKHVYLLYDTRTDGSQTGEVSRYFKQLKYLYSEHFNIVEKQATYKIASAESITITVKKTPQVMTSLKSFLSDGSRSLSASSINTYINCPLQFYFSVVENLDENEDITETIEANVFGTIFHNIMENIYASMCNQVITSDLLHKIIYDDAYLTEQIEIAFAKNYFKNSKVRHLTGQNFLTGEVLKKYVKQILLVDCKLTPFTYKESERKIKLNYQLPSGLTISLKGILDRIDEVKGHLRIIDYKTGKGALTFKNINDLFDKEVKNRPKAIMQVFMYAHLYLIENPSLVIEPCIYYLRNCFDKKFNPGVVFSEKGEKSLVITSFESYQKDFKKAFDDCLTEIFDENIPFTQTSIDEACKWCKFSTICKK